MVLRLGFRNFEPKGDRGNRKEAVLVNAKITLDLDSEEGKYL